MKRVISFLVIFVMLFTLVACSENTTEPQGSETSGNSSQTPDATTGGDDTTTSTTEPPVDDEYNRYRQIADHNIYVDFKTGRRDSASLNSHVFYGSGEDIVVFVYSGAEYSGSVDGIMDLLNDGSIPLNAIGHTDAKFKTTGNYPINVAKTENTRVGSNDCVKFTGEVTDANGRICFSYGYTFIVDGKACMLVGFVFTEAQASDEKLSISTEIDKMMASVRTEI